MTARVAAWSLGVIGLTLIASVQVLDLMNGHQHPSPVVGTFVGSAFLVVGALIASRRPRNPIGWIYLGSMTLIGVGGSGNVADQYALYALVTHPGSLPAADWVLSAGQILLAIGFSSLVFFSLLLFPDGRLPSPRWRPVAFGAVAVIMVLAVDAALTGDVRPAAIPVANPIRLDGAGALLGLLNIPLLIVSVGVILACLAAPFVRFRVATGVERQQLKWFAFGASWIPATALTALVLGRVAPEFLEDLGATLWPLSVAGIPVSTAVAILRLRLYDIDVIINRTLVYGVTTGAVATAFFGGIVIMQTVLRPFTSGSEIAVAASTLLTVALFQPLRVRIQHAVDRRFYRSRYDAGRTIDAFAEQLRDEVDLEAVRVHLLGAVAQTMSPAHASVWLRRRAP